ncbi:glycosyltransferase [Sphaerotilus uruguayifluvii]|nr:glycosyltransferase [Leptothrix sp. C29]NRT58644.1 glycosyltransferase involved in cell wall biosynthesis [Leptothrix sp. C29]
MKIILAGQNYFVVGGSDQVLLAEEQALLAAGHEVAPFAAKDSRNLPNQWEKYFPENTSKLVGDSILDVVRSYYSLKSSEALNNLICDFRPDILHCHIYYGKLTASIIRCAHKNSIPIVQTLHEYKLVCPTYQMIADGEQCEDCSGFNYYKAIMRSCNKKSRARTLHSTVEAYVSLLAGSYRLVDKFIAVSDFQRNKIISMGVDSNKIVTVYNGVDMDRMPYFVDKGDNYGYMGRVEDIKGIWEMILAFEVRPDINLVVMGDGSLKPTIEQYINSRGIKNILMVGFCGPEKKEKILQKCKCILVPSKWDETFGLVAVEALAMGLPVICSNRGGLPEVVRDGVDAIVLKEVSPETIGAALDFCESGDLDLSDMGRRGSQRVRSEFSMKRHVESIVGVYKELLG